MKRYYADKAKDNSLIILPDGECAEKSEIADETVSTYNKEQKKPPLYLVNIIEMRSL